MKTVILKSKNLYKANQKNNLPFVGDIEFNENAEIEVDEIIAEKLIKVMPEFSFVDDVEEEDLKKKSEDSEELGKSEESDIKPQVDDNELKHVVTSSDLDANETLASEGVKKGDEIKIPLPKNEGFEDTGRQGDPSEFGKQEKPTKETILNALNEKSATELKEILKNYPTELTSGLKNKTQYVEFLVDKLSE